MNIIVDGHEYGCGLVHHDPKEPLKETDLLDWGSKISFVMRFRGEKNHPGTTIQELLRISIDRLIFLDKEKPWPLNAEILHHLRMALVLFEARALVRKVEKGDLRPEEIVCSHDGHFFLTRQ